MLISAVFDPENPVAAGHPDDSVLAGREIQNPIKLRFLPVIGDCSIGIDMQEEAR
jgi:hypothetical protein